MGLEETAGIWLGVLISILAVGYVLYGAVCAFSLSWQFVRAAIRGCLTGHWGFVLGAGWFLLLGGLDLLTDQRPGEWMIGASFGVWILASVLYCRSPAAPG